MILLFQRSSVVEQSAVNRSVVGSSPTAGAIKRAFIYESSFLLHKIIKRYKLEKYFYKMKNRGKFHE